MNELALGLNLTPGPMADLGRLGTAFLSELNYVFGTWLLVAAVLQLIILPLALRRSEHTSAIPAARVDDEIRAAA